MPKSTQSCPLLEEAALASEQHTTEVDVQVQQDELVLDDPGHLVTAEFDDRAFNP
jgi:hypothetical protein